RMIRGLLIVVFQAEDGIRDRNVTGVQTCALPIFENIRVVEYDDGEELHDIVLSRAGEIKIINEDGKELTGYNIPYGSELLVEERSEERRVGKECRKRSEGCHYKR